MENNFVPNFEPYNIKDLKRGNGIFRAKSFVECYWPEHIEEIDSTFLRHNDSTFLTKKELKWFILRLCNAYKKYDEIDIDNENILIKEYQQEQLRKMNLANDNYRTESKPPRKKTEGHIYFITYDNKYYKIGKAKNLKNRIKVFSVEMPGEISVTHTVHSKDTWLTENLFHEYFKQKRIKGEWFDLSEKDLEYVKKGKYTKAIMKSIEGAE